MALIDDAMTMPAVWVLRQMIATGQTLMIAVAMAAVPAGATLGPNRCQRK